MIENNLPTPIIVCIGYHLKNSEWRGMISQGWYTVEPGQTTPPIHNFSGDNEYFLYYVQSTTNPLMRVTNGQTRLLVHPTNAFNIRNADLSYIKSTNPEYEWRIFKKRVMHFGFLEERKYTFRINISDVVDK